MAAPSILHHGDDDGHSSALRNKVAWLAERLLPEVKKKFPDAVEVDPTFKLYRLEPGAGRVALHVDEARQSADLTSRYSLLVFLNDGWTGGETIIDGEVVTHQPGNAIVFNHSTPHEGLEVKTGVKFVLKTDVWVKPV